MLDNGWKARHCCDAVVQRIFHQTDLGVQTVKRIFISYRRSDSQDVAGRIFDCLKKSFGPAAVFMDVNSLPLGVPFPEVIRARIEQSAVVLVLIGPTWATTCREGSTDHRLEEPNDFVRREIETALARKIPLVPITVTNAKMTTESELPDSLKPLAKWNAQAVRPDPDFHQDMACLIERLQRVLDGVPAERKNKSAKALLISFAILLALAVVLAVVIARLRPKATENYTLSSPSQRPPVSPPDRPGPTSLDNDTKRSRTSPKALRHPDQNPVRILTKTTLTADPVIMPLGQPISLTAKVTAGEGADSFPPGWVRFDDANRELGSSAVNATGLAVVKPKGLTRGQHSIRATFVPSGSNIAGSSDSVNVEIRRGETITKVSVIPSDKAPDKEGVIIVTLEARVTVIGDESSFSLSGFVRFNAPNLREEIKPFLKDGTARLINVELPVGKNQIRAVFEPAPNSDFGESSSETLEYEVKKDEVKK